jgi:hypothetical protein
MNGRQRPSRSASLSCIPSLILAHGRLEIGSLYGRVPRDEQATGERKRAGEPWDRRLPGGQ